MFGFKLNPPKILFNKPKAVFPLMYEEEILADINFTEKERAAILAGIKDIEHFCNGMVTFTTRFDLEPTTKVVTNCSLLLKVTSENTLIKAMDKNYNLIIMGLCQFLTGGARIIYLVKDRLHDEMTYRTTTAHEFGHYMGMSHIEGQGIMHKHNFGLAMYPTYDDAVAFAKIYSCSPEDLKYFKL